MSSHLLNGFGTNEFMIKLNFNSHLPMSTNQIQKINRQSSMKINNTKKDINSKHDLLTIRNHQGIFLGDTVNLNTHY